MDKENELRQAAKWAGFAAGTCESIRSLGAYRDGNPYSEFTHPRADELNKSFAFLTRCYAELKDRVPALADELIGAVSTAERIEGLFQGCDYVPSWHHAVLAHTFALLYHVIGDHIWSDPCDWGKDPPDLSWVAPDAAPHPETVSINWAGAAERLRQLSPLPADRLEVLCQQEAAEAIRRLREVPTGPVLATATTPQSVPETPVPPCLEKDDVKILESLARRKGVVAYQVDITEVGRDRASERLAYLATLEYVANPPGKTKRGWLITSKGLARLAELPAVD